MIRCEWFVYGHFKENGYRLLKTPDIEKTLSQDVIKELRNKTTDPTKEDRFWAYLPNEQLIAVTYQHPTIDERGRPSLWKHIILIRVYDYLQVTKPTQLFESHFIKSEETLPQKLEPIQII